MSFWEEITKDIDIAKSKIKSLPVYAQRVSTPPLQDAGSGRATKEFAQGVKKGAVSMWESIKTGFSPRKEAVPFRFPFQVEPIMVKDAPITTGAGRVVFDLLEAIPRGFATVSGEIAARQKKKLVKTDSGMLKIQDRPKEDEVDIGINLKRFGFENPKYKTAAKEVTEALNRGENAWEVGLRVMSQKTLDVAFGASLAADLAKLTTSVLAKGPLARQEAQATVDAFKARQKQAFNRLKDAPEDVRLRAQSELINARKKAEETLEKLGKPTKTDKVKLSASRYAEVLGRETKLGTIVKDGKIRPSLEKNLWDSFLTPDIRLKTPQLSGNLPHWRTETKQLPGTRERPGQAPAFGMSAREFESVGKGAQPMSRAVEEYIKAPTAQLQKMIDNDKKIFALSRDLAMKKMVSEQIRRGEAELARRKGVQETQAYKGEKDLTTKILKDLEGKTTVSKQYILDATNRGELKQVERDLIRKILGDSKKYPDKKWVETELKQNLVSRTDRPVLDTFIIGSEAKGTAKATSDLDIAVIVPEVKGKTAQQLSANYHSKFTDERFKPKWNGRTVDFQFFYKNDPELLTYSKIPLGSDTINVSDFAKKVKAELLPLERTPKSQNTRYENVSLPSEVRGPVADYSEHVYNSPIKTSAGDVHFKEMPTTIPDFYGIAEEGNQYVVYNLSPDNYEPQNAFRTRAEAERYIRDNNLPTEAPSSRLKRPYIGADNYFGHTRIEDMADNKTRRVIEVQSDLYQKGNLEREKEALSQGILTRSKLTERIANLETQLKTATTDVRRKFLGDEIKKSKTVLASDEPRLKEVSKLEQYNDPTAHFRMVREEIKKAAQDGKTKLQFPTGETAMKIEQMGPTSQWIGDFGVDERGVSGRKIGAEDLKEGLTVWQDGLNKWEVTDVLENGKFKAVPVRTAERYRSGSIPEALYETGKETFDVMGRIDDTNPIYKFYEKDMGRYLTNKFGAKTVIDDKGVSWYEVPIKKEYGEGPVEAFGVTAGIEEDEEGNIKINPIKAAFGIAGFAAMNKSGAIKTIEEFIAQGKARVVSRAGKDIFQVKQGGSWVNATGAKEAVSMLARSAVEEAAARAKAGEDFGPRESYQKAIEKKIEDVNDAKAAFDAFDTDPLEDAVKTSLKEDFLNEITEKATVGSFAFKPIGNIRLALKDPIRTFEKFFGKTWPELKEVLFDPLDKSKGAYIDTRDELADDLFKEVTEKLGIKAGSEESAAVMNYGERNLEGDFAPPVKEDEYTLIGKFGKEKAQKIIAADAYFRKKYNELIDRINDGRKKIYGDVWAKKQDMDAEIELLKKNIEKKKAEMKAKDKTDTLVYNKLRSQTLRLHRSLWSRKQLLESDLWWRGKVVPKRNDYYRHYQELAEGFEALKNILKTDANISTSLAGISPVTKPKSKFLQFAQKRTGNKSERDAVGSFLNYIPSASYAIHIDPHIEGFRKLADALRKSENKEYSPFIEWLTNYANELASKSSEYDRSFQLFFGRKIFRVIDWLNNRVKANTILANASSSLAQIFNVPQGIASAKQHAVKGVTRSFAQVFGNNLPMKESTFLKERYAKDITDQFDESMLKYPKKFALWMLTVLDEVGTKFIWNSHYEKALAEKIANPIKYADDMTRKLVAGRGIGEVPLAQKSKVFQMIAPFQLEVGNAWAVMGDFISKKDFAALIIFFTTSFLMNRVAEEVRGSDVVFDPIQALREGIQSFIAEENKLKGSAKLVGRLAGEVLSNVPLGQSLAAQYPEYGIPGLGKIPRRELFGKGDPTRFGSGLVLTRGLTDPLFKILPPFGGAQIKKTYEGAKSVTEGNVKSKSGDIMYKQGDSKIQQIKAILFGKYSTSEARDYFNRETIAEKEYQRLKGLSVEERKSVMGKYKEEDPYLYRKIRTLKEEEDLGITGADKKIKALGVENGARAEYIYKQGMKLKTKEEKDAYIKEMKKKKILTDEVFKQLKELIKSNS